MKQFQFDLLTDRLSIIVDSSGCFNPAVSPDAAAAHLAVSQ